MIHSRSDYQRIQDPENKILADEPVFLLRAQDETAAETVRYWIRQQKKLIKRDSGNMTATTYEQRRKLIALADAHAYRMDDWPCKKAAD